MSFTSRLVNYKRKEVISGRNKTTFFTEVNTDVKVGDKVFIANGNYDTHDLIVQDEYNANASGYKVLKINGCSVTLDIDWTNDSTTPFSEISSDDCIKVWTVSSQREFDYYNGIYVDVNAVNDKKFKDGYGNYIYTVSTVLNGTYSLTQGQYWVATASLWSQVSMVPPKIQSYQSGLSYNSVSDYSSLPIPIDRTLQSFTSSPSTPPSQTTTLGKSGYIHGKYPMDIGSVYRLTFNVQEGGVLNNGSSNILEIYQAQDISNKNAISTVLFDQLNGIVTFQLDFLSTNSYIYLNRDVVGSKYIIKLNCDDFFGTFDTYGRADGYTIGLVNSFGTLTYTASGLTDNTFLDDFIINDYVPQLSLSPIATYYDITTENLSATTGTIVFTAKFLTTPYEILSYTHSGTGGTFYTELSGYGYTIIDFELRKQEIVLTSKSLNKLIVIGDSHTNNSTNFHQGPVYKHNGTNWVIDKQYTPAILGKSSFRDGYFQSGVWYDGLYGTYEKKITWLGLAQWKSGMFLNSTVKGLIESKTDANTEQKTVYSKFENNVLQQSTDFTNNKGYGYNYFIDSEYINGTINNANFIGGIVSGTMSTRPVMWYYLTERGLATHSSMDDIMNGFTSSVNIRSGNLKDTKVSNSIIERATLNNIKGNEIYVSDTNIFNSDIFNSVSNDSTFDSNSEIKINSIEVDLVSFGTQSYRNIKMYADWDRIKNLNFGRKIYLENVNFVNDFKINNIDFSKNYLYMDSNSLGLDYNVSIKAPAENASINNKSSIDIMVASSSTISPASMFNSYIRTGYFDGVYNGIYKGNWINDRDFILKSATVSYNISHTATSSLTITLATYSGRNTWWDNKLKAGDIVKLDTINYAYATQSYSIEGAFEVTSVTASTRYIRLSPIGFSLPSVFGGTFSYTVRAENFATGSSVSMITYHGLSKIEYRDSNNQNGRFARVGAKWTTFGINSKAYNLTFNNRNYNSSNQSEISVSVFDKVLDTISRSKVSNTVINDSILSNSTFDDVYLSGVTVSNSNISNSSYNKQSQIFLSKQANSFWSSGQSINSTFSTVYWHDGSFNGGLFTNGTWKTGVWYNGQFGNPNNKSDSNVFLFGDWLNGYFYNSTFGADTTSTLPWGENAGVLVFGWTGSISGITGSNLLNATGTTFSNVKPGYLLRLDNKLVTVVSVISSTQVSVDTTWSRAFSQTSYKATRPTNWYNGNFESGTFRGRNVSDRELVPNAIWYNGVWKNGTFIGNSVWKGGEFRGGKFLSVYGSGTSSNIIDFAWQNGLFTGGQFGDSKITRRDFIKFPSLIVSPIDPNVLPTNYLDNYILNSSWYDGEFDGGIWNGNVWNNGTFSNGMFEGRPSDASITRNDGKRTTNKVNLSLNNNFIAKSDTTDRSNWKQKFNYTITGINTSFYTLYDVGTTPVTSPSRWYYGPTGGMVVNTNDYSWIDLYQGSILQPGISYDIEITYKSSGFNNVVGVFPLFGEDTFTFSYPNFRIGPGYESIGDGLVLNPTLPSGKQLILKNTNNQIVTDKMYGVTVSDITDLVLSANGVQSTVYSINVYESIINNYPNVSDNLIMCSTFSDNSNWVGYSGYNTNLTMVIPSGLTALGATDSFWYLHTNNGVKLQPNSGIPAGTTFSLYQDLPIVIGKYYDIEVTYNNRIGSTFKGANDSYSFTLDLGSDSRSYSIIPPTTGSVSTILIENRYASSNRVKFTIRKSSTTTDWLQIKEVKLKERVAVWNDGVVVPSSVGSKSIMKNFKWNDGDFKHNKGQVVDGIWYDGVFRDGEFVSGVFNPYSKKTIDNGINVLADPKFKNNRGEWKVSTSGTVTSANLIPVTGTSSIYNWKITSRGIEKTYNSTSWYLEQRNVVTYGTFYNITVTAAGSGAFSIRLGDIITGIGYTVTVSNTEEVFSFGLTAMSGGLGLRQFVILPQTFNGYIKEIRMVSANDTLDTYNLDDTCYWENGTFVNGDFNISEFKNGLVKNGNFTSAIMKYSTWLYGNAYNLVWEDGRWRNGNWYGADINLNDSSISATSGVIGDNMIRQQLLNPMRYYGSLGLTSSQDIFYWNMTGWKTVLTDHFTNNNNGWYLIPGYSSISGGSLQIAGLLSSASIVACKIGSLYRIDMTYRTTNGGNKIGIGDNVVDIPSSGGATISTTFEIQSLNGNSIMLSNQYLFDNIRIDSMTVSEFQYATYSNTSYTASTQSFSFNLSLQTPPGTTSSIYSYKRSSPVYGKIGNGNFISGQWEYGNWISGKRYDTKSIELSTSPIISWGKIFKNKSAFVEYVQNQWFVILKSSVTIATNYKVGDKITIGNITYIDINDNRKYINLTTISAINDTQFTVLFESPFLIKSVEQDNINIPVRITKNNWIGGVFLNGVFDNGIWVNGYVKGLPGVTRMTNTVWLDGKFDGGYFGEGNSVIQNTYLRLNTSTSSNSLTYSVPYYTDTFLATSFLLANQSFVSQIDVPYTSETSNAYDVYGARVASSAGSDKVLGSLVETKLNGFQSYLNLGSKWKKYYSPIGTDGEFVKQGGWNIVNGVGITSSINSGYLLFQSTNGTGASSSLTYTYSLPVNRYQVSEFSIVNLDGGTTMSLTTNQRTYNTIGTFREFYYNLENLRYQINKSSDPSKLVLDYVRIYETDMMPFYKYYIGTSSFYYNPIKPYEYTSEYIDLSGNDSIISYTWDTYFLPDNSIITNR